MIYTFYITSIYEFFFFLPFAKKLRARGKEVLLLLIKPQRYTLEASRKLKIPFFIITDLRGLILTLSKFDKVTVFYRFPYIGLFHAQKRLQNLKLVRCIYGYSKYTGIPRPSYTFSPIVNNGADVVLSTGNYSTSKLSLFKKTVNAGAFYVERSFENEWEPYSGRLKRIILIFTWDEFRSDIELILKKLKKIAEDLEIIVKLHPMDAGDGKLVEKIRNSGLKVITDRINLSLLYRMGDVFVCDDSGAKFEALLFGKPVFLLSKKSFLEGSLEKLFIDHGLIIPMEELGFRYIESEVKKWIKRARENRDLFDSFIRELYDYNRDCDVSYFLENNIYENSCESIFFEKLKTNRKFLVFYYNIEPRNLIPSISSLAINGLPFSVEIVPIGVDKIDGLGSFVKKSVVPSPTWDNYLGAGFFFNLSVLPDGWMWSVEKFLRNHDNTLGVSPLGSFYFTSMKGFYELEKSVDLINPSRLFRFLRNFSPKKTVFFGEDTTEIPFGTDLSSRNYI